MVCITAALFQMQPFCLNLCYTKEYGDDVLNP